MARPPNILLIMTDQLRRDWLGCYGADWLRTPNLDRLAAEGARFSNCAVNNPICTPSRASIFTGQELPGHGVYRLHDVLPDDQLLFPELLRIGADYRTALFGKLHVSGRASEDTRRHPNDGFEIYEWCMESCVSMGSRFNGYVPWLRERAPDFLADLRARGRGVLHHPEKVHFSRWAAERTADFIRSQARRPQPFFCTMSLFDPHNPYQDYPLSAAGDVERSRLPKPIVRDDLPAAARRERAGSYLGSGISAAQIEEMRFGYAASIAFADRQIGHVLDALEEIGAVDETLVIFTSDHGDALGDHRMMVKGVALYEPVIKVPLILRWPGQVPKGAVADVPVQGNDIARSCLAAAGVEPPSDPGGFATGRDLVATGRGEAPAREAAICAYRNSGINADNAYWDPPMHATAAVGRHFKLIAYTCGDATEYEFFDLINDPAETQNLVDTPTYAEEREALFRCLAGWLQREGGLAGSRGGGVFPASDDFMNNRLETGG